VDEDFLIRILADGLLLPIVILGAFALLRYVPHHKKQRSYARVVMAGLTALLFAKLVGSFWQPDAARPFVEMGVQAKASYLDNAGFPSDHTLFSFAIAYAVWFETRKKTIAVTLFALAFLVGMGRILALVHTPLDVAGGIVFATLGALWYFTNGKSKL
jgi:membrane-associated phospholipid phosphatase